LVYPFIGGLVVYGFVFSDFYDSLFLLVSFAMQGDKTPAFKALSGFVLSIKEIRVSKPGEVNFRIALAFVST